MVLNEYEDKRKKKYTHFLVIDKNAFTFIYIRQN